jgi:hypothetical protein
MEFRRQGERDAVCGGFNDEISRSEILRTDGEPTEKPQ